MGNVLSDDKNQQVIVLGRLGWSLRRIEEATAVRRETVSRYLKAARVRVRRRGGRPRACPQNPAPARGVSPDVPSANPPPPAPAPPPSPLPAPPQRAPSASACES